MSAEPLSPSETESRLESLPGWALEGDRITRTFRLPSHFAAAALTVHIAQIQDELNHHSDLTLGYNTVALAVHTHSAGGRDHREGPDARRPGGGRISPRGRIARCVGNRPRPPLPDQATVPNRGCAPSHRA
ncbi:pterin-4-alpha-carbinolamine dehydratase [Streptomyces filamentosus NRRL 15998]|uniref:Putative pterin-4-alpha-carbinolamine dehydratase n=1 Tax=Streptomyces filamentosus NRRL 15998 TaxID=457431 RepID=D6ADZ3_STRFL|nr:pterin-4-alpha-carbinolamine dehydratase [Streptomyces filamentosus NRRL 15998]